MLDGWRKMDPPTQKVTCRGGCCGTLVDKALNGKSNKHKHERAVADLTMIAFYYLLRVGEYTVKAGHGSTRTRCNTDAAI